MVFISVRNQLAEFEYDLHAVCLTNTAYLFLVDRPNLIERMLVLRIIDGRVADVAGHQAVVAVGDLLGDLQSFSVQRFQLMFAADDAQLFPMTIIL